MNEILYGITPVEEALRARRRAFAHLWVRRGARSERLRTILDLAAAAGVEVDEQEDVQLQRHARSKTHQGVVLSCGTLPLLPLREILDPAGDGLPIVLALDRIEDPQNLGALVRTAAFLGARSLLVHRSHRAPMSAAASKASAGCLEWFPIAEAGNLADALQRFDRQGWRILGSALEAQATPVEALGWTGPTVLVMGNEGQGLRPLTVRRCHELVHIPRRGRAESLNVTVAAGILLEALAARAQT